MYLTFTYTDMYGKNRSHATFTNNLDYTLSDLMERYNFFLNDITHMEIDGNIVDVRENINGTKKPN